jgi:hypothetical protein
MKKTRLLHLLVYGIFAVMSFTSCKKEEDETPAPTNDYVILSGDLPTQTLDASKKYLLQGFVFVQTGQVLTIPAGTFIFGDKATKGTLIINKGGRIIAEGTAQKPIVFTSKLPAGERDRGDWGGVIILGNARVNQANTKIEGVSPEVSYGNNTSDDFNTESSGVLKFVRIEFAGIALSPDNEINGLTFGGVGSGTVVENVQVSYSGDDAFEWFGGTVNCKNLVVLGTWDDDFDTDFGYTGKIQFALSVRRQDFSDAGGSNSLESDNNAGGTDAQPKTSPVFSNLTILGPLSDTLLNVGSHKQVVFFRKNTEASLFNSVLSCFPTGINIDEKSYPNYQAGKGQIANNLLISPGNPAKPFTGSGTYADSVGSYYLRNNISPFTTFSAVNDANTGINANLYFARNTNYPANPNFVVNGGLISSGTNFSYPKLSDGFFQQVPFLGAFGATDWTDGWSNFDPKNQTYP